MPQGEEPVELESFYRVGRFLGSILDIEELLKAILEEGLETVGGTRGFVGLVNRSTGDLELRIVAGQGWEDAPTRKIRITDEPGSGITIRVITTAVPYMTGDVRREPHYLAFFPDVRSEIAVPLVNRDGRVIGVINIESEQAEAFSQRDLQLLVALANQAAIAISVANYRARESALIEIGNELAFAEDMDELLRRVVLCAGQLLRADDCSLFQLDESGESLVLRASGEMLRSQVGAHTYRLGEGLTGWVAQNREPARVADVRADPRWRGLYPELPSAAIEAYLAVPVSTRQGLWGVLRVVRRKPASSVISNEFTERDQQLLTTLARQVGAAITQQTLIDRQIQMERMAAWGEMSARSAHMIGNKVFALKGQLNELEYLAGRKQLTNEEVLEVVQRAKTGVFRLEEILNEFRDFLLATHLDRQPADLNELVQATVRESFPKAGPVSIQVETEPGLPPVLLDGSKMRRAISELLENSVNHLPKGGAIRVVTGRWETTQQERYPQIRFPAGKEGDAVRIEVLDTGPGIPDENRVKLFTPFFTTRSKGMGLGLPIVKGIVDAHEGVIEEVGQEGVGAYFIIVLPAAPTKAETVPTPEP